MTDHDESAEWPSVNGSEQGPDVTDTATVPPVPPVPTGRRPWTWQRLTALPLTVLVRAYRLLISPMLGPRCRWHPSCSTYALTALETHGPIKGLMLTVARLLRCNPLSLGGLDPVPPRGAWRPTIQPDGSPRT